MRGRRALARANSSDTRFESAKFLNIDLDVRSRRSLAPLIAVWPRAYLPLATDERAHTRWLIINPGSRCRTAEAAARDLLREIEQLAGEARRCWMHAHRRTFDIGIQAAGAGRPFEDVQLSTATLSRIAAVGAAIQMTVYPAQLESSEEHILGKS